MPCFFNSCLRRSFGRYSGLVIILEKNVSNRLWTERMKTRPTRVKGRSRLVPFWRQNIKIPTARARYCRSAPQEMKIVSWNVNGLRASIKNSGTDLKGLLDRLDADIICFQETKAQRQLKTNIALFLITSYLFLLNCRRSAGQFYVHS